jgi:hypothetical protein
MPYPYEDEGLDLQRIPGTRRSTHTPARTDTTVHTTDKPFCYDPACSCHQDTATINEFATLLYDYINDGLLTVREADMLLEGRTV